MKFKLGADPEFFLMHKGKPVSAHNIVPGTKDCPCPVDCGAVQADGTAVEINIEPANSPLEFAENLSTVLKRVREMVPAKYDFYFRPTVTYEQAYFKRLPLKARELGCDPDFDATQFGLINHTPKSTGNMRTGAGHIHIGWTEDANVFDRKHVDDCCVAVNYLDETFGRLESAWCNDDQRRTLYGKRGAFRPKPYGVEYRVPSNAWLNYPRLWPWMFETITFALQELAAGSPPVVYGQPTFEDFRFATTVLPSRYPSMPTNVVEEKEPWEFRF